MADYRPPVGFHFKVEFLDIETTDNDILFQSVSGLTVTMETETIKEGGSNQFEQVLPVRSKYSDLVLKRGLLKDSKVITWCLKAMESFEFQPTTVHVHLLNDDTARSSSGNWCTPGPKSGPSPTSTPKRVRC